MDRIERNTLGRNLLQSCNAIGSTVDAIMTTLDVAIETCPWKTELSRTLWRELLLLIHFNNLHLKLLTATEVLTNLIRNQTILHMGPIRNSLRTLMLIDVLI